MEWFSFEGLEAHKEARKLVVEVYKIINFLPYDEKFGLGSQMRRSVISVPANLAEGSGRVSYKEKVRFIEISYGSLMETYSYLLACVDLNYIANDTLESIQPQFQKVSRLITGLRKSFMDKVHNQIPNPITSNNNKLSSPSNHNPLTS